MIWLIPCLIAAALFVFLAWVLCRSAAEQEQDREVFEELFHQEWMRRRP